MGAKAKPLVAQVREKGILTFVGNRFPAVGRILFGEKEEEKKEAIVQPTMTASRGSISVELS